MSLPTRRWFHEPLVQFLAAGALLFVLYGWANPEGSGEDRATVRVTEGDLRVLAEGWSRQWQRPPSKDELRGLAAQALREEILAREARALGLDEGDTIVRRRLAQKLQFLIEDTAPVPEPSDDELRRLLESEPERFGGGAKRSFEQLYFDPARRRDAAADVRDALEALRKPSGEVAAQELGDPPPLVERVFREIGEETLAGQLGQKFAASVFSLPAGEWHGPIESSYGVHAVRVTAVVPARTPDLSEVREQVAATWRDRRRRELEERSFDEMSARYTLAADDPVKELLGEPRDWLARSDRNAGQ